MAGFTLINSISVGLGVLRAGKGNHARRSNPQFHRESLPVSRSHDRHRQVLGSAYARAYAHLVELRLVSDNAREGRLGALVSNNFTPMLSS